MVYVVDILSAKPAHLTREAGRPAYRLPEIFSDLEEAADAALDHIERFGCTLLELSFQVRDEAGAIILTGDDPA